MRDFSGETDRTRQVPDVEYKGLQVLREVSRLEGGLCHHQYVWVLVTQRVWLCSAMDHSPLGSSVYEILQARRLECVAISVSRGSSQSRDRTQISCIAGRFFTIWVTREVPITRIDIKAAASLGGRKLSPGYNQVLVLLDMQAVTSQIKRVKRSHLEQI